MSDRPKHLEFARQVAHAITMADTDEKLRGLIRSAKAELLRRQQRRAAEKFSRAYLTKRIRS